MYVYIDLIIIVNLDVICECIRIYIYGVFLYYDVMLDCKNDVKCVFCFWILDLMEEFYYGEVGVMVKIKFIS